MFTGMGLHVVEFPSGRFGYVGSIPTILADIVPADTSAIMGQRWFKDKTGEAMMYKFPSFATKQEAIDFALEHNCTPID
jgi:hypothetical protein